MGAKAQDRMEWNRTGDQEDTKWERGLDTKL